MDVLLIGGVSGSGKSVALAALEDSGYYAVNNLPLPLVAETADYLAKGESRPRRDRPRRQDRAGAAALPETIADSNPRAGTCDSFTSMPRRRLSSSDFPRHGDVTRSRADTRTLTEAIEYERGLLDEVRPLGLCLRHERTARGRAPRDG